MPRGGVHDRVPHLPFLLPGAGLLRGHLPDESQAATRSEGEEETPGQLGRPARSPGPARGLPETVRRPFCDGCRFPPPRSIRQYRTARTRSEKGAARRPGNHGMGPERPVSAAPGSDSHRLPAVRAGGTDRIHPLRGGNGSGSERRRRAVPAGGGLDAFDAGRGRGVGGRADARFHFTERPGQRLDRARRGGRGRIA